MSGITKFWPIRGAGGAGSFLRLDGTNGPMTGLFGLAGPAVAANQPVTLAQLQAAALGTPLGSVHVVSTVLDGNIALTGPATIDGVVVPNGEKVLLEHQTDPLENRIYVVNTGGAWTEAASLPDGFDAHGAYVSVVAGATYASEFRICISDPAIVGTDGLTWNFQAGNTYFDDGVTTILNTNIFSIRNGGITDIHVNAAAAIAGTKISPNFGAQNVVTTGDGTFRHVNIDGTGTNGWVNLHGQTSPPSNATAIGDIRIYANTSGFGGFGAKTGGGQAVQFNIDQVNTGNAEIIIQDETSIIMANVPASGFVTSDGATLSSQASIDASLDLSGIVPYGNGGTNASTVWTPGSNIFAGATTFAEDNANWFYDNATNRVGIRSAAAPQSALTLGAFPAFGTLYPTFDEAGFGISSSTAATPTQMIIENTVGLGSARGSSIALVSRAAASVTQGGDRLGSFQFGGNPLAGSLVRMGAIIQADAAALWTPTSCGTHLKFLTTNLGTTTPVEHMRLFPGGNLTVGNIVTSAFGTFNVSPLSTSSQAMYVRSLAGQTGDMYVGAASTGVMNFRVLASGEVRAPSLLINVTTGAGFVELTNQTVNPGGIIGASRVFSDTSGFLGIAGSSGFSGLFDMSGLTASRTYEFQDASQILGNVPTIPGFVKSSGTTLTSTSFIDAATDIQGILDTTNGGTGLSSIIGDAVFFASSGFLFAQDPTFTYIDGTNTLSATNITATANLTTNHLLSAGTNPTIVRGAGSGPTSVVSVSGEDMAGTVTVATAGGPSTNSIIFTLTFGTAYGAAPKVVFSPRNRITAGVSANQAPFATTSATTFTMTSGSVALTNNATFVWDYHVIG